MSINLDIYKELKADFQKKNNKKKKFGRQEILLVIFLLMFFVPIIVFMFMKSYERIDSFGNISDPIQIPTT